MDVFKLLVSLLKVSIFLEIVSSENSSNFLDYERLKSELMNRLVTVRKTPADLDRSTSDSFRIGINVSLLGVVEIDQIEQFMTIAAVSLIGWQHNGLTWDSKSYGDLNGVLLDTDDMWLPHIGVLMGNKDSLTLTFPDTMSVNSSGFVSCIVASHITFRCRIDVRKYPFDTQTCSFGFYSLNLRQLNENWRIYLSGTANLNDTLAQADPYSIKGEWKLLEFEVEQPVPVFGGFPYFTLKMRRQRLYYVMVVIFPLVLTSLMIPLVFLIPKNSGEKISYLVTIFTSTAIFLSYISTVMPKNLATTPFLGILITEVLCQGFCATLAALWVVIKYDDEELTTRYSQKTPENLQYMSHDDKTSTPQKMSPPEKSSMPQKMYPPEKSSISQKMSSPEPRTEEQSRVKNSMTNEKNCRHGLTGRQLDTFFFCFFQIGQILFITYLFLGTDWMG